MPRSRRNRRLSKPVPCGWKCTYHLRAHAFHVVDQLADWSPYCHQQYRPHFEPLSESDRALLAEHAALRGEKGWGQGLEQTFYSGSDLDGAIREGIDSGHLTEAQGEIERRVLSHFSARTDSLMAEEMGTLERFLANLESRPGDIDRVLGKGGPILPGGALERSRLPACQPG